MKKLTALILACLCALCGPAFALASGLGDMESLLYPFAGQVGATEEIMARLTEWAEPADDYDYAALFEKAATAFPAEKRLDGPEDFAEDFVTGPFLLRVKPGTSAFYVPEKALAEDEVMPADENSDLYRSNHASFSGLGGRTFYDLGRFDRFAQEDAPIVFCVIECLGTEELGAYGTGTIYANRYRCSLIDAGSGELIGWFPVEYEGTPPSFIQYTENDYGLSVAKDVPNPWNRLYIRLGLREKYPFVVREDTVILYNGDEADFTVPDGILALGTSAFAHNDTLETITLPDTLETIGDMALYWCGELKRVEVPGSVRTIGESAFAQSWLEEAVLNPGLQTLGKRAFSGCPALHSVTLPEGLETIEEATFERTSSLTAIALPEGIAHIGDRAFAESGLEEITLPQSVRTIGAEAFASCEALQTVVLPAGVEAIDPTAFDESPDVVIQAPAGSYAASFAEEAGIPFEAMP